MSKRIDTQKIEPVTGLPVSDVICAGIASPEPIAPASFDDARAAVDALRVIYDRNTAFLRDAFHKVAKGEIAPQRFRAFYPELRFSTASFAHVDTRLAYGHVSLPGDYATTLTRPDLFDTYLMEQIRLLVKNHGVPVTVQESTTPIPLHFAFLEGTYVESSVSDAFKYPLRDMFDVPDLGNTDDSIVNGDMEFQTLEVMPLAPFTGQRVDYSLHRLSHYTATSPSHFQNYVLFTNYQFYLDEFCAHARNSN